MDSRGAPLHALDHVGVHGIAAARRGRCARRPAATSHWLHLEQLRADGAEPTSQRVVREGKVITAAGVSAGIDMALTLAALEAGDDVAQAIQLAIEYDPQPPFDAGSPAKAPAQVVELVRAVDGHERSDVDPRAAG